MSDTVNPRQVPDAGRPDSANPGRGGNEGEQRSPSQQRPPTDNERKSGTEQDQRERRSNLAGDQDVDDPIETEEGRSAADGLA